jgi:Fibrobacter succinogenes major domain (Fib_succ_major).
MTDPRDNKTYRTVQINGQIWMAENLNFAGNKEGKSSCYGNDDNLCEIYGRLYTREAAMNSSTCGTNATCNLGSAVQGVCPNGWHIPSLAETNDLMELLGKSVNSWVASKGWAIDRSNGDAFGMLLYRQA